MREGTCMLNAEGQYVLFVCEGVAEQYILTTLIERGELTEIGGASPVF